MAEVYILILKSVLLFIYYIEYLFIDNINSYLDVSFSFNVVALFLLPPKGIA
jgi:hypothetical protein